MTVRTFGGDINEFLVNIGLHKGSALSPFLFACVIDELTKGVQDEVPWCTLFADNIILINEIRNGVNIRLERWRHTLECRSL